MQYSWLRTPCAVDISLGSDIIKDFRFALLRAEAGEYFESTENTSHNIGELIVKNTPISFVVVATLLVLSGCGDCPDHEISFSVSGSPDCEVMVAVGDNSTRRLKHSYDGSLGISPGDVIFVGIVSGECNVFVSSDLGLQDTGAGCEFGSNSWTIRGDTRLVACEN